MSVIKSATQLGASGLDAAKAVVTSPKAFYDQAKAAFSKEGAAAAESIAQKSGHSGFLSGFARSGASTGMAILKAPVEFVAYLGTKSFNGIANLYRKAPLIAVPATLVVGAMAVNGAVRRRAQQRTNDQLVAGINDANTIAAGGQPVSYMNSASYADVQSKMEADRASGAAPSSQAAALASRDAAPQAMGKAV